MRVPLETTLNFDVSYFDCARSRRPRRTLLLPMADTQWPSVAMDQTHISDIPAFAGPAFMEGSCSTEESAKRAALMWKSVPTNMLQLPDHVRKADGDGDGLINKDEFKELMRQTTKNLGEKEMKRLFAQIDADGDGELTMAELKKLSDPSEKVKCEAR